MQTKSLFWVITANGRWGRGVTPKAAEKAAGLTPMSKVEYCLQILNVRHDTTDDEMKILFTCWGVSESGNLISCHDNTDHDKKVMGKCFVSWSKVWYNRAK